MDTRFAPGIHGRIITVVVFVCVLAAGLPARAGTPVPVWFAGDDTPDAADRAQALVQAAIGPDGTAIGEVTALGDALFGGARLWPLATALFRCEDATPIKLETAMARAERALEEVEFVRAVEALAPVDMRLACVDGALDSATLGRAALLLGHVRHFTGDVDGARRAFAQAAVFDPDVVWDGNFSPAAQPIFNEAVLESLRTRDAHVRGSDGSWALPDVELDGGPVPRYGAIRPGRHQLALRTDEGGWVRVALDLAEGQTLRLAPVDGLAGGLEDDAVAVALTAAVADALEERGAREAWLVDLESDRVHRYRTSDGGLSEVKAGRATPGSRSVRPPRTGPQEGGRPVAGPVMVIGGAVTTAAGLAIGLEHRRQALAIYENVELHNEQFERYDAEYRQATQRMTAGYVMAAIGGAILVAGVPTWVVESRRGGQPVSLSATLAPLGWACDGGALLVIGQW